MNFTRVPDKGHRNRPIEELSVVKTCRPFPEYGLEVGAEGTVVMIHHQPSLAYEVEFIDDEGDTLAMFALLPEDIEPT